MTTPSYLYCHCLRSDHHPCSPGQLCHPFHWSPCLTISNLSFLWKPEWSFEMTLLIVSPTKMSLLVVHTFKMKIKPLVRWMVEVRERICSGSLFTLWVRLLLALAHAILTDTPHTPATLIYFPFPREPRSFRPLCFPISFSLYMETIPLSVSTCLFVFLL